MSRYLFFSLDERGRIRELRVTRRRPGDDRRPAFSYGRPMSEDLSAAHLRVDDLPPVYAEPMRERVRRTGDRQGVVEIEGEG